MWSTAYYEVNSRLYTNAAALCVFLDKFITLPPAGAVENFYSITNMFGYFKILAKY